MKYQLTQQQIEEFRISTPLKVDDKLVPFKIICDGKVYKDPRGNSNITVFIQDFSCKVSSLYPETAVALQNHFVRFMSEQFEDYAEDYLAILEQKQEANNVNI